MISGNHFKDINAKPIFNQGLNYQISNTGIIYDQKDLPQAVASTNPVTASLTDSEDGSITLTPTAVPEESEISASSAAGTWPITGVRFLLDVHPLCIRSIPLEDGGRVLLAFVCQFSPPTL